MSHLAIALLGSFWVTLDGTPLAFATDKVRALLAYLAVEADRAQRREALAALLWPGRPESAARTSLRQALYRLRCTLGDRQVALPHLSITAKDVQWNPAGGCWLDVAEFEARIALCRTCRPGGQDLCPDCVTRLEAALQLYRGDFLTGFTLPACPDFEWWQLCTQEACHRGALEALHRLVVTYEAQGDYASVSRYARKEIELEPWRESAHRRCMRALALSGQRGEALHQYEICRRLLAQEMNVEPSGETTQLYERIRSGAMPGIVVDVETTMDRRPSSGRRLPVVPLRTPRMPAPPLPGPATAPAA